MSGSRPGTATLPAVAGDYQQVIHFGSAPDAVFDALTSTAGLAGWWTDVTGSGAEGGELRFTFDTPDSLIVHVDVARRPTVVRWSVPACAVLPDWVGTSPTFELTPLDRGGCELHFRHRGLTPVLECFDQCRQGWDHYLPSLHRFVESGLGAPFPGDGR